MAEKEKDKGSSEDTKSSEEQPKRIPQNTDYK